eukprot:CAMPEP_0194692998 /NCGR_PEP_ID=MMETSP0295-20121207/20204_1 /TAXON_ID=39354 /ORGANISM="Heterosigma akashiwo, Strain CCMP2393" /LENGTH=148 /DNA_ID=CAMNT_0039583665 /DNA_START=111 /DNA_END=553 /DNA_ORIENTATION=-
MEEDREDKTLSQPKEQTLPQKLVTLTPDIIVGFSPPTSPQVWGICQLYAQCALQKEPNSNEFALDIHNRWLTSIRCLDLVPKLRCLDLSFNFISKVEGLEKCPELRELKLYSNKLEDAEGLGCCRKLEVLHLTHNQLLALPKDLAKLG